MQSLKITKKVLMALCNGLHIVTPDWIELFSPTLKPLERSYVPEFTMISFFERWVPTLALPNLARKTVFQNLFFVLFDQSAKDSYGDPIYFGGGEYEVLEPSKICLCQEKCSKGESGFLHLSSYCHCTRSACTKMHVYFVKCGAYENDLLFEKLAKCFPRSVISEQDISKSIVYAKFEVERSLNQAETLTMVSRPGLAKSVTSILVPSKRTTKTDTIEMQQSSELFADQASVIENSFVLPKRSRRNEGKLQSASKPPSIASLASSNQQVVDKIDDLFDVVPLTTSMNPVDISRSVNADEQIEADKIFASPTNAILSPNNLIRDKLDNLFENTVECESSQLIPARHEYSSNPRTQMFFGSEDQATKEALEINASENSTSNAGYTNFDDFLDHLMEGDDDPIIEPPIIPVSLPIKEDTNDVIFGSPIIESPENINSIETNKIHEEVPDIPEEEEILAQSDHEHDNVESVLLKFNNTQSGSAPDLATHEHNSDPEVNLATKENNSTTTDTIKIEQMKNDEGGGELNICTMIEVESIAKPLDFSSTESNFKRFKNKNHRRRSRIIQVFEA
jgi:hypothetical protein